MTRTPGTKQIRNFQAPDLLTAFLPWHLPELLASHNIEAGQRWVIAVAMSYARRDSTGRWVVFWADRDIAKLARVDKNTANRAKRALVGSGLATVHVEADGAAHGATVLDMSALMPESP